MVDRQTQDDTRGYSKTGRTQSKPMARTRSHVIGLKREPVVWCSIDARGSYQHDQKMGKSKARGGIAAAWLQHFGSCGLECVSFFPMRTVLMQTFDCSHACYRPPRTQVGELPCRSTTTAWFASLLLLLWSSESLILDDDVTCVSFFFWR